MKSQSRVLLNRIVLPEIFDWIVDGTHSKWMFYWGLFFSKKFPIPGQIDAKAYLLLINMKLGNRWLFTWCIVSLFWRFMIQCVSVRMPLFFPFVMTFWCECVRMCFLFWFALICQPSVISNRCRIKNTRIHSFIDGAESHLPGVCWICEMFIIFWFDFPMLSHFSLSQE